MGHPNLGDLYGSISKQTLATGKTTLALHPASESSPAGKVQPGFHVPDLLTFYQEMTSRGIAFTQPPTQESGSLLARFLDGEGIEVSVSED